MRGKDRLTRFERASISDQSTTSGSERSNSNKQESAGNLVTDIL
jgi:hypothetical protein